MGNWSVHHHTCMPAKSLLFTLFMRLSLSLLHQIVFEKCQNIRQTEYKKKKGTKRLGLFFQWFSMLKTVLTTKIPVEKCKVIAVHVHYDSLASWILVRLLYGIFFFCLSRSIFDRKQTATSHSLANRKMLMT